MSPIIERAVIWTSRALYALGALCMILTALIIRETFVSNGPFGALIMFEAFPLPLAGSAFMLPYLMLLNRKLLMTSILIVAGLVIGVVQLFAIPTEIVEIGVFILAIFPGPVLPVHLVYGLLCAALHLRQRLVNQSPARP